MGSRIQPDDLIKDLEGIAIRTTQGSFVKVEDVRRLIERHQEEASLIPEKLPLHAGRALARQHLKEQGFGQPQPAEPGRAVPATDPQPSSRT